MPMALRERIAADIKEAMEGDPIMKDRLTRTGQLFNPGGPAEFGASIEVQRATVAAAANALGFKPNSREASGLWRRQRRRTLVGQAAVGDGAVVLVAAVRALHADRIARHRLRFFETSSIPDRIGLLV